MSVFDLEAKLTLDSSNFTSGLSAAKSAATTAGKVATTAIAAVGTATAAVGTSLVKGASEVASYGDTVDKMSQKIGISAEAYQEWDYVFQRCGASVGNLQSGMKKLSGVISNAESGSSSAQQELAAVGLTIDDLNGKSQDEQLSIVVSALQEMEAGAERTAAASDLLGRSATDMAAVLNMTADETEALKQEAIDYGMVMSDDAVAASAAFEDSLTKMQGTITGVKNSLLSELLPGLTSVMDGISDLIAGNDTAGEEIKKGVESMISSVSTMIPKFVSLVSSIASAVLESAPEIITSLADGIINALPELMPTITKVIIQIISSLVSMLPQIVSAGVQIIISLIKGIAEALPELMPEIAEVIVQIVQAIVDNLPLILDVALQLMEAFIEGILQAIPVIVESLPKIITSIVDFILGAIPQIIDAGIKLLTALVENLPTIIKKICEAIPKLISGILNALIEHLPDIIDAGVQLLVALIQNLPTIIKSICEAIPQIISGIVEALTNNIDKIIMAGVEIFVALIENLPTIIIEICKAAPKIIEGLVSAFGQLTYKIVEIGGNLVKGLWDGIVSLATWLWDKVSEWISGIWDGICNFFGIHSPSKEMAWVGEMLVKGLAGSIDENGDQAVKSAEEMSDGVLNAVSNLADEMETALPTNFNYDVNAIAKASNDMISQAKSASYQDQMQAITAETAKTGHETMQQWQTPVVNYQIDIHIANMSANNTDEIEQLAERLMEVMQEKSVRRESVFA